MATLELDPLFVKALRLLHSKAKDSAEQLRQLLDDALNQQKHFGSKESSKSHFATVKQETESMKSLNRKLSPKHVGDVTSHGTKPSTAEDPRKKDVEKRPIEKLRLSEHIDFTFESKKARLDSPQPSRSSSSSPQPPRPDDSTLKVDDDSDSTEGNGDADEFAMEMGLACIVCKQIDVSPGNQLVECQECHNLYHQECHRPPATDHDVNDPRQVWYCSRCTKNMKKMTTKPAKMSKTLPSSLSSKDTLGQMNKGNKSEPVAPLLQPFKRAEIKVPSSQNSGGGGSSNKPIGLAGLAANLSGRSLSSSSSSSLGHPKSTTSNPFVKSTPASSTKTAQPFSGLSLLKSSSSSSGKPSSYTSGLSSSTSASVTSKPVPSLGSMSKSIAPASLTSSARPSSIGGNNGGNSSGSNSGGGPKAASSSSLMSADKRLQIMKKKAAAKMQEKRRLSAK